LAGDGQAGDLVMFDQLSEPGVIDVAAEIAGLYAGMPEARRYKERGA